MGQMLSSPITDKVHTTEGEDSRIKYAGTSMQGWRISGSQPAMEDAHTTILNVNSEKNNADTPHVSFFAVFDGHGGTAVAQFAGQHLHNKLKNTTQFQQKDYITAMKRGFLDLDEEITQGASFQTDVSGCTACACLITEDWKCIIGNVGDSRAVLSRGGNAIPLSVDHKPNNEKEFERISRAGGFVQAGRVNGNLAMSRALGDLDFKRNRALSPEEQAVTGNPEVFQYPLIVEDEFIIIACDGIWDCLGNQEVVDFVRLRLSENRNLLTTCSELMHHCLAEEIDTEGLGCDNMTVVIIALIKGKTEEQWYESLINDVRLRNIKIPKPHLINENQSFNLNTETESDGEDSDTDFMKSVQEAAAMDNEEIFKK